MTFRFRAPGADIGSYHDLKRHKLALDEDFLREALRITRGNKDAAARLIGMSRRQMQRIFNRMEGRA